MNLKLISLALALLATTMSAHAITITEATITGVGPVTATVTFKTDVGARGSLIFIPLGQTPNANGTYPGLGTAISTSTGTSPYATTHKIVLNGLFSDSTYTLSLRATDATNKLAYLNLDRAFRTLPKTDTTPPVISNIAITLKPTSINATFRTNEPAISFGLGYDVPGQPRLRYGVVGFYNSLAPQTTHTVDMGNLLPNTAYVYTLVATDLQFNKTTLAPVAFRTPK